MPMVPLSGDELLDVSAYLARSAMTHLDVAPDTRDVQRDTEQGEADSRRRRPGVPRAGFDRRA